MKLVKDDENPPTDEETPVMVHVEDLILNELGEVQRRLAAVAALFRHLERFDPENSLNRYANRIEGALDTVQEAYFHP